MSHLLFIIRTLFFTALVGTGLSACDRNTGPVPETQHPEAAFVLSLSKDAVSDTAAPPGNAILFYGARPAAGGPPVYVARREQPRFPSVYYLTDANLMGAGGNTRGPMVVFARLDSDGDAMTVGAQDWVAETSTPVTPGNTELSLLLAPHQATPEFRITIAITSDAPLPEGSTLYALLRNRGGRVPLGALKAMPRAFPVAVTLTAQHLMANEVPPLDQLEVIIKVDQDGNPQTTVDGDLYGVADAAPNLTISLTPDTRTYTAD